MAAVSQKSLPGKRKNRTSLMYSGKQLITGTLSFGQSADRIADFQTGDLIQQFPLTGRISLQRISPDIQTVQFHGFNSIQIRQTVEGAV